MASASARQLVILDRKTQLLSAQSHSISSSLAFICTTTSFSGTHRSEFPRLGSSVSGDRNLSFPVRASPGQPDSSSSGDNEEGISLGTMRLSSDINIPRFELLLFQWANSLNQGAQLPLPVPMKVDKIDGGVRLGFVSIDEGKANVEVYIDCVVTPGRSSSEGPMFRAIRKGVLKDRVPPGEPRIMKSLLAALKTSAELART